MYMCMYMYMRDGGATSRERAKRASVLRDRRERKTCVCVLNACVSRLMVHARRLVRQTTNEYVSEPDRGRHINTASYRNPIGVVAWRPSHAQLQ